MKKKPCPDCEFGFVIKSGISTGNQGDPYTKCVRCNGTGEVSK